MRLERLTTILPCSTNWSVINPPCPLHPLPLRRALWAVQPPVILTVIQDAVSKPTNRLFRNILLTRTIWDMAGIPQGIPALLRAVPRLVPPSANQVSCNQSIHKIHGFLTNPISINRTDFFFRTLFTGHLDKRSVRGSQNEFLVT